MNFRTRTLAQISVLSLTSFVTLGNGLSASKPQVINAEQMSTSWNLGED